MLGMLATAGMNMFGGSAGSGLLQGTPLSGGGAEATAPVSVSVDAKLTGGPMTTRFGGGSTNTILIIAGILAVVLIMGKKK